MCDKINHIIDVIGPAKTYCKSYQKNPTKKQFEELVFLEFNTDLLSKIIAPI